jgi:chromosome segregation ATPase
VTDAWQSIKIRSFEHVSAGPTTSLLRVDGKPAWRRGSSPRPTLLVDTAGEPQRFAALPAPPDPRGLLRAAYSVPSTTVGSESRFWLEHLDGSLTELPAPTKGASRRDPTVGTTVSPEAAPDIEELQLPDAPETERRADVHAKLAEQSGALAESERAAIDNEQARRAAEAELTQAQSEIGQLERRQAEAQAEIERARAEARAEIERGRAEAEHIRARADGAQADTDRLIADLETATQSRIAEAVADAERRVGEAVTEADGRIADADARAVAADALLDQAQNRVIAAEAGTGEAQDRVDAAESRAADADARAAEAESRATEAAQRAAQAEQTAAEAEQAAGAAEARAAEAEQHLSETEAAARQAEQQAEQQAAEAEQKAAQADHMAAQAEQKAAQAEQKAAQADERARSTATELAAAREHAQELRARTQELERLTAEQEERIESMDRMLAEKQPEQSALERELQALRSSRASVEQELDQARDALRIMTFERDELSRQAVAFDGVAIKARERATKAESANERLNETIEELQTWRGELERRLAATTSELGVAKAAREADERELKRMRELLTDTGQHGENVDVHSGESSHTLAAQAAEIELLMAEVTSLRAGRDPVADGPASAANPQAAERIAALEAERAEIARRAAELGAALVQVLEPARVLAELAGTGEGRPATGAEANLELVSRAAERSAREQAERELRAAARGSSPGRRQPG